MAPPKGNQYWRLAHNFKKPRCYQPDELLDKAVEYAQWCEKNPLKEEKVFGTGVRMSVNKMRAMTIQGFCLFANMDVTTFYEYEKQDAYSNIITRIRAIFYSQKLEGAAADLLNPNIIARELGLSEKTDVTSGNKPLKQNLTVIVDSPATEETLKKLREHNAG